MIGPDFIFPKIFRYYILIIDILAELLLILKIILHHTFMTNCLMHVHIVTKP